MGHQHGDAPKVNYTSSVCYLPQFEHVLFYQARDTISHRALNEREWLDMWGSLVSGQPHTLYTVVYILIAPHDVLAHAAVILLGAHANLLLSSSVPPYCAGHLTGHKKDSFPLFVYTYSMHDKYHKHSLFGNLVLACVMNDTSMCS